MLTRADQLGQSPCREGERAQEQAEGANTATKEAARFYPAQGLPVWGSTHSYSQGRAGNVYYGDTRGVGLTNSWVTARVEAEGAKVLQGDLSQT